MISANYLGTTNKESVFQMEMQEFNPLPPRLSKPADNSWEKLILVVCVTVVLYFGMWAVFFTNPFPYRGSELHKAVHRRDFSEVKRLVEQGANVQAVDEAGTQALCSSVWMSQEDISDYLLQHGGHLEDLDVTGSRCYDKILQSFDYDNQDGVPERRAWIKKHYDPKRRDILMQIQGKN